VPPPRQASSASFNVRGLLARDWFLFPCIFILFLLVISPVLIGLFLGVMLGLDLWVRDVNIILVFGLRKTSVGLRFSQPSVSRNKCWLGVLNPQCQ
jgi:hypothetical protein